MNMILRNPNLNYGNGYMRWLAAKRVLDQGLSDWDAIIADTYHILFVNCFCNTYVFETLDKFKRSKWYRHQPKQLCKACLEFVTTYDGKIMHTLGSDYIDTFADMNDNLQNAFQQMLTRLEEASFDSIKAQGAEDPMLRAKIEVSIMLTQFAVMNLDAKIKINMNDNPIADKLRWLSQRFLYDNLVKLGDLLPKIDITKDIIVRDRWLKLEKFWANGYFVADNLGDTAFRDKGEADELKDVIYKHERTN